MVFERECTYLFKIARAWFRSVKTEAIFFLNEQKVILDKRFWFELMCSSSVLAQDKRDAQQSVHMFKKVGFLHKKYKIT